MGQQSLFLRAPLLPELQPAALHARLSPQQGLHHATIFRNNGQGEIFIFRTGTIVCWGLAEQHIKTLRTLIKPAQENPVAEALVEQEREVLAFEVEKGETTRLDRDRIVLNKDGAGGDRVIDSKFDWLNSAAEIEPMVRGFCGF